MELGKTFEQAIKGAGKSKRQLSLETGIAYETLRRKLANPDTLTVSEADRIAAALGMTLSQALTAA